MLTPEESGRGQCVERFYILAMPILFGSAAMRCEINPGEGQVAPVLHLYFQE